MNDREVAELRRRLRPNQCNITHVRGCYVGESGEILSEFDQSLGLLGEEESEHLLSVLRKTLSGKSGRNLMDITFSTRQVADSDEHRLLMRLRESALQDDESVHALYQKVIDAAEWEGSYLILLAHDRYDVPWRGKDGRRQDDAGDQVFSYLLCAVCPIKLTRPALSYQMQEQPFYLRRVDWLVSPPTLGFLFPAFDERSTNLYGALYYSKSTTEAYEAFVDAVFHTQPPMPADAQRETFQNLLAQSLDDECRYGVVQAVNDELCTLIEDHRASRDPEPLAVSKETVRHVLENCGVSEQHVATFSVQFDEQFGAEAQLRPDNLVDSRQFRVRSGENVVIQVNPLRSDLVETRIIDGRKYILVRAEDGVSVNGVDVDIS